MTNTARLEFMKKCLKEDFGITTKEQFYEEFKKMQPIDISVFTAQRNETEKKGISCN